MQQLIHTFYTAFSKADWQIMADCYHADVQFSDEAFVGLQGKEVGAMWRMLLERGKGNTVIQFFNVQATAEKGSADWVAEYLFSATGRKVKNKIHAEFEFKEGRIYRHTDSFNLHKWAGQAMGFKGKLLGGFGFFRKKVQQTARISLQKFMERTA